MAIEQVAIPEGRVGSAQVCHFDVGSGVETLRLAMQGRPIRPGRYTKLLIHGQLMMSDTPAEMSDHYSMYHHAKGTVLINGLGLGMIAAAVAKKPEVDDVWIVESNPDVVALVAPYLPAKCNVFTADAFSFKPVEGVRFGAVWHDIWIDLCTDNLTEMTKLKRKYARRADWQGCWGEELLRHQKRREVREARRWGRF